MPGEGNKRGWTFDTFEAWVDTRLAAFALAVAKAEATKNDSTAHITSAIAILVSLATLVVVFFKHG